MISTAVGDILDSRKGTILHQVNCSGITGGLAAQLYKKWPAAFAEYFIACESGHVTNLGTITVSPATSELLICHVFGQVEAGAGTNMHAVEMALKIARLMRFQGPVYAPYKMGCGIGGGDWAAYSKLLQTYFPDLIIVRRPQDMGEEAVQVEVRAGGVA